MIWDELTYLIPLLMIFLIFIVYAIVIGHQSRFVEKKQQNIEQLERLEEFVRKYSYDYDAEPMRNEEGRVTRIPIKASGKKGEEIMETCRQRLQREHPEKINKLYHGGCDGCPGTYGYIPGVIFNTNECLFTVGDYKVGRMEEACAACWNRPVENTCYEILFKDATEAIRAYGSTDGEPMPPELARKEKYKDSALECKALFDAMKDAGFDEHKAFMLTKTFIAKSLGSKSE